MTGPDASSGEMPGFPLPGRLGREHDEPALDMILDGLSPPPDAPPQMRGLSQMLSDLHAPAGPGELTAEAEVLAGFRRCVPAADVSGAAGRPARHKTPGRPARHRAGLAAALVVAAAGLGGTAAAYAGVLPGPVQVRTAVNRPPPSARLPIIRARDGTAARVSRAQVHWSRESGKESDVDRRSW
jgi:hypothetical protein